MLYNIRKIWQLNYIQGKLPRLWRRNSSGVGLVPGQNPLSDRFRVSTGTIRKAFEILEEHCWLFSRATNTGRLVMHQGVAVGDRFPTLSEIAERLGIPHSLSVTPDVRNFLVHQVYSLVEPPLPVRSEKIAFPYGYCLDAFHPVPEPRAEPVQRWLDRIGQEPQASIVTHYRIEHPLPHEATALGILPDRFVTASEEARWMGGNPYDVITIRTADVWGGPFTIGRDILFNGQEAEVGQHTGKIVAYNHPVIQVATP